MFVLLSKSGKVYFWQTKCTNFKHILALLTYDPKSPVFEQEALKKWKMEPGHPVLSRWMLPMALGKKAGVVVLVENSWSIIVREKVCAKVLLLLLFFCGGNREESSALFFLLPRFILWLSRLRKKGTLARILTRFVITSKIFFVLFFKFERASMILQSSSLQSVNIVKRKDK